MSGNRMRVLTDWTLNGITSPEETSLSVISAEASQVTAVGGFEAATVGWFDRAARQFRRIPVDEQCEVLSLVGDVAEGQDGPVLHAHVVLGLPDGTTRGGHLIEGRVFPTLEVVVTETPARLRKVMRPDIGLALIDLDRSEA